LFFWSSSTAKSLSLCAAPVDKIDDNNNAARLYLDGLAKNCGRNNGPNSTIKTRNGAAIIKEKKKEV
jgi:hypothetical protein